MQSNEQCSMHNKYLSLCPSAILFERLRKLCRASRTVAYPYAKQCSPLSATKWMHVCVCVASQSHNNNNSAAFANQCAIIFHFVNNCIEWANCLRRRCHCRLCVLSHRFHRLHCTYVDNFLSSFVMNHLSFMSTRSRWLLCSYIADLCIQHCTTHIIRKCSEFYQKKEITGK